jgi:hypothetical protein
MIDPVVINRYIAKLYELSASSLREGGLENQEKSGGSFHWWDFPRGVQFKTKQVKRMIVSNI